MEKKISQEQIALTLGLQKYLIASWEKQLDIVPFIESGEPFYTDQHLSTFRKVKELLYEQGLTMAAAKSALKDTSVQLEGKTLRAASPLFFESKKAPVEAQHMQENPQKSQNQAQEKHDQENAQAISAKLLHLKSQLIKISSSL
jgi:hypothetical protein